MTLKWMTALFIHETRDDKQSYSFFAIFPPDFSKSEIAFDTQPKQLGFLIDRVILSVPTSFYHPLVFVHETS